MDVRLTRALAPSLAVLAFLSVCSPRAVAAVSEREAERIADRAPEVAETAHRYGPLETTVSAEDAATWEVGYFTGDRELALVVVDRASGELREAWTGDQVAWPMARGYEEQFGHSLNAPYVWLPLCALFLLGLLDWRRPLRIVHLDLLLMLAFGASHVFFNRGEVGVSVPLVYPVLGYLLARALWVGFRGGSPLRPSAPVAVLAAGCVFLLGFRAALNIADSGVIDVGHAGVVGADRIGHGEPVYGENAFPAANRFGDTYGPANYYAYVPFELALPWAGEWDELPAAHAAAIFFDLATVAGLFALGGRLRPRGARGLWPGPEGRSLGTILAFAWLAYPYSDFALQSNANDSLVAALLVWALVAFASPVGRGVLLAVAALVKFAPLALAPLFAMGTRDWGSYKARRQGRPGWAGMKPLLLFAVGFAATAALLIAHPAIDPGLATFWERTVENQLDRDSPFSVWGQEPSLGWLQIVVWIAAAGLALLVAFLPRRRSVAQVAALASAVLIASQLAADHWFYLYIPWFAPLMLAALAASTPHQARLR